MSTAPDIALEFVTEPSGFVVVLPLMSANKLWKPVIKYRGVSWAAKHYAAIVEHPKYTAWKKRAGQELMIQRPSRVPGRVAISIVLVPDKTNRDTDNVIKAALDLLVSMGRIEGDTVKTVQRLEIEVWTAKQTAIPKGHMQVRVRGLPEAAE